MSATAGDNQRPIIIKRKKVVAGDGHHGGAWKVAYADFVTAMMAFFMLMWLLNATTEKQRKGIADYFAPTIPINRVSGGGADALSGDSVMTETKLAANGDVEKATDGAVDDGAAEAAAFAMIEEILNGSGGESRVADELLAHIVTKVTDEGLIVELFALPGAPLFELGTAEPTRLLTDLSEMIAEVFNFVRNDISITGHVASEPIVVASPQIWPLSLDRATAMRLLVEGDGIAATRIRRVAGKADREPVTHNRFGLRNNRLELVLMRSVK